MPSKTAWRPKKEQKRTKKTETVTTKKCDCLLVT